jgi:hypothetical protein
MASLPKAELMASFPKDHLMASLPKDDLMDLPIGDKPAAGSIVIKVHF